MKKQLRWSLAIITLLSLAGCGLKGPLYFPPAETSATQVPMHKMDKVKPEKLFKNSLLKDNISMNV
ncbi:LPS translocon maturation chaperone LptM [Xenorhabdus thuongxuanensis]|uniref:LPS-assembly lipoprotein LptM n=1 Tax=Xenorhabdus thuongxuanensis TaxID=1873484 RepID=A0A1Q5TWY3_9GAMM|nr:lipoprotein [Xenorhabdus thuongxuanensis]OKP04699.1 OmpA/MotB protein [Xenorhabdus thuongxuanensis]